MLRISHISLFQFKNYADRGFDFTHRVTGICGRNGTGKTNLLDAIHYLCFTKSYFGRQDSQHVMTGKSGFRIEGDMEVSGKKERVTCILRETGRKEFSVNGQPYEKFSAHIGRYPCVVIAPDDAALVTGGSEERRKFMDALLSQLDGEYLRYLIQYTRILQQRNSLLRSFAETGSRDLALLDVLDEQLLKPGDYIFNKRRDFLLSFLPAVARIYQCIVNDPEDIRLFYETELLQATMKELLSVNRNRDLASQRTNSGIHRDDIDLRMGEQVFRSIASQGQRKSLLFALKLAEMDVLKAEKGFAPLLLLDDVFEKLDEERISNLLHRVCVDNDGQVFITDTHAERLTGKLQLPGVDFRLITL